MQQGNVFYQDRVPGVPGRWALGVWLTNRKLASAAWVPGQRSRMTLLGREPYWQALSFPNLAANTNAEDRFTVTTDMIVTAIMGSGVQASSPVVIHENFNVQLFNSGVDEAWNESIEPAGAFCGSAQQPFILRRPQPILAGTPLICRIYNAQAGAASNIQVVLYGVLGRPSNG